MTKRKAALGKGLGALLPDSDSEYASSQDADSRPYSFEDRIRTAGKISDVAIDRISPNPFQPREHFDEAALEELAQSIRHLGIIQPLTVRSRGPNQYELISGERRLRAARLAGLERVPAFVREADTEAMLEMAIVENVQREQLNPIEISLGYQRLMDECDLTQEQVAEKVGKSRPAVANYLRLLKLPPVIQAGLRDGHLSIGHARALLSLGSDALQREVLEAIVQKGLSVRETEAMVKRLMTAAPDKKTIPPAARVLPRNVQLEIDRMTDRIRNRLGTKVSIKPAPDGKAGRIEVAYYSSEDLERLTDLLADN